ncbi:hypothetical protein FQN54_008954 [Arachnomyces sp. PD_36]|nr:hypothetical protein FQN54_008954 [Arachnomyces sp. PD_36]
MADPLSIAANIAAVTVPALHAMRLLLNDLRRIKDAPETVKDLEDDIRSADKAVTLLQAMGDSEWKPLGRTVADETKIAIGTCERACKIFRSNLQRWTSHSEDGKLSRRDRANVGFFKQDQIESMSKQLQRCKITINSMVGVATLYSSIRHAHVTEEIKETISTKQIEIRTAIDATNERRAEVGKRLEEHGVDKNMRGSVGGPESRADALRQIEEERTALSASRKLLDELLVKVQEDVVMKAATENLNRSTHITFGSENSGFEIGISNGPISGISFGVK